jgi:putative phosphoesterase
MMKIGLISDTHMPARWKQFPDRVFSSFADVDLILHAGDVGDLWVLDELSQIAPVVAVHGNDETEEATAALPYLQTLSIAGHRLVMTHAHYPIRAEELASRTNDWESKFERRANFAKEHGASICIFGHTHIPMDLEYDGIRLINPGAIASGNFWTKQTIQTVAILRLEKGKSLDLEFIDLATGDRHEPFYDPAGFLESFAPYNEMIYEDAFLPQRDWLWWTLGEVRHDVRRAIHKLSFEVWDGKKDCVTMDELAAALLALDSEEIRATMRENPSFAKYC